MAAVGTVRIFRPDPASANELQRCGRATFAVRPMSSSRAAVAVVGEIDAVNGRAVGHYVERHTGISRQLVLDLRAVDFAGTQAFTALHYISVHCARADVDWTILGSPPLHRLLKICDPDGELPLAEDVPSGLARLDRLAQCRHSISSAV
jgi:anti-anti-sigma regulatory factor